jgi:hypothetical protein
MTRSHTKTIGVLACISEAALVINKIGFDKVNDVDVADGNLSSVASEEVVSTVDLFTSSILDPAAGYVNIHQAVNAIAGKMDLKSALTVMDTKTLPKDVSGLVQTVSDGDNDGGFASKFDENSLEKARVALNSLVEKAWHELDDKIFKCKGKSEMLAETRGQVTRDIMRLIEQINDLERIEAEAIEGASQKEQEILDVEALLDKETQLYNIEYAENKAELTIRQNDLDVFQFILKFTKCKDATAVLSQTDARVCETVSGRKTILYSDTDTAAKYQKLLTPRAKRSIDRILRAVESEKEGKKSLLQAPSENEAEAAVVTAAPAPAPSTTTMAMTTPAVTQAVQGEDGKPCLAAGAGGEDECMKSCGPDPPDCGLLHDKLSLMWGEYKDKVEELTMEMMKNFVLFTEMKENLNAQIRMLSAAKARFQQLLAEARSNLAADRTEVKEKGTQKRSLDHQISAWSLQCKKRINWIMYQDMCAIKVVRNAVLENSTKCPSATIQDCDLDTWVRHQCSVSCDDTCDVMQPFKCGGWAKMTRGVVASPDKCGIKCPLLERMIRCGQYHCPVNCLMSRWSGWSKCTADCEGGLQSRTRSMSVKPKNGGTQCNTVQESRPCNTGSCDRDCRLQQWTPWTPCSVACGGGFQEQMRHVLIPTRGDGKCPKAKAAARYGNQRCNIHPCNGDEICIAQQDLVIAVDGSGSVRESGFKILKSFTKTLLQRYKSKYWGQSAVKIGVVLFGNGVLIPDPSQDGKEIVSPALNKCKLTGDIKVVEKAVDDLPYKKGFTNMAQAFSMAEDMFVKGSRKGAQQAVMLVTDGKPSFAFMTNEMVEQLDDKGIMRYFFVVNEQGENSDAMKQMKRWASQPWETNLIHVPGLLMLEADTELWAERALTMFCPMAISPPCLECGQYQHVKDGGWCGKKEKQNLLSKTVADADSCAALATGANKQSFLLGTFFRRGYCFGGTMDVDAAQYLKWKKNPEDPECPTKWQSSMLFDFYAMKPTER